MQLAVHEMVCSTWWCLSKREYEKKTEMLKTQYRSNQPSGRNVVWS